MPKPRKPTPLTLVLDENLTGEPLRAALAVVAAPLDCNVELLESHFPRGTKDQDWLPEAGRRGWAVVTLDVQIKRRPNEREILEAAGVMAFILRGNGMNGDQLRDALVAAIPAICRRARQLRAPIIAHIHRDGGIDVILGARRGGPR